MQRYVLSYALPDTGIANKLFDALSYRDRQVERNVLGVPATSPARELERVSKIMADPDAVMIVLISPDYEAQPASERFLRLAVSLPRVTQPRFWPLRVNAHPLPVFMSDIAGLVLPVDGLEDAIERLVARYVESGSTKGTSNHI